MLRLTETDIARLLRAAGAPRDTAAKWAPHYFAAMRDYAINTSLRIAHFIAQTGHESDGFRTTREYASGAAYEGRRDLGNISPGDGRRFRGHGLIQLTGRFNHNAFKIWLREQGIDFDPIANPSDVEKMPWAMLASVFYWTDRGLNALSDGGDDLDDIKRVTRRINGGYNGLRDRTDRFVAVMAELRKMDGWGGLSDPVGFGPAEVVDTPAPPSAVVDPIPAKPPRTLDKQGRGPILDVVQTERPSPPPDATKNTGFVKALLDWFKTLA